MYRRKESGCQFMKHDDKTATAHDNCHDELYLADVWEVLAPLSSEKA